jgi:tRNA A-37 threonylcarbamoyl transferase component Bud32
LDKREEQVGGTQVFGARDGRLHVVGARADLIEAVTELVLHDHELGGSGIERIEIGGERAWFKRSALRGSSRWRWAMRRVPRVREHDNLLWLSHHALQAPVPLAAGSLVRGGLPLRQFLITRDVPDATTLESFLRGGPRPDRADVLDELARETARMHALGFVHHDLYPRNVLVLPARDAHRIAFVDAWAGGPPPQLRPAVYDLACLFLRADRELGAEEVQRFVDVYAAQRGALGRPVAARSILGDAKRIRARLIRRLIARPHELRGEPIPGFDW